MQFDHQSQPTLVQMGYVPPDHATVAPLANWDLLFEQGNAASAVQAESDHDDDSDMELDDRLENTINNVINFHA